MNCIHCEHCEEIDDWEYECWIHGVKLLDPESEEICDDFVCS